MRAQAVKLLRALSRRFGVDLVRHDPLRSVEQRRLRLLRERNVDLVLDVGANVGQYGEGLRRSGYQERILSFEPLSSAFSALQARASSSGPWECKPLALGAHEGEIELNVAGNSYSSSVLPMLERHVALEPGSAYVSSERVRLRRLDDVMSRLQAHAGNTFLKLDVQGFEGQVLDGAPETLRQVVGVETELSLVPLYQGQALFAELIGRLGEAGFALVSIDPGFADRTSGQILQVDGIFVRPLSSRTGA